MKWVEVQYPQYASKINFLNNGVEKPVFTGLCFEKVPGSVIAVGGDRNTKNNKSVSNAIGKLNGGATLEVYGCIHKEKAPKCNKYTKYMGLVSQDELYRRMARSELFVLNSIFEPFSLSVIDALNCRCSILLSNNVGINGLLDLEESDIIFNPYDENEIKEKVEYLLKNPNFSRIACALDYDALSYKKAVERLKILSLSLLESKRIV